MGQVNATEVGEQALVNGESDNFSERKDFPNGRETMNCVKDKIDLLIEGCLLAKDSDSKVSANASSSDERKMVRKSPKLLQQLEQENCELMKNIVEATPNAKSGADEKKMEAQETQTDSAKLEKVKKDFIEGDDVNNKGARNPEKEEEQKQILSAKDLLEEDERYRKSHVSYSTVIPTTIKIKPASYSHAENEQNRMSHSDSRTKVTTFQTFIDNVLDNSLKNNSLSSTEQSSLNSFSLQESSTGIQSSTKTTNFNSKVCSDSDKKFINEVGLKIKQEDKWKDTASVNMSQVQVLCLKDHIERVLEKSFHTDFHSTSNDQKSSREELEQRSLDRKSEHSSMAGKSPVKTGSSNARYDDKDSVCSPEGLVNSILNQSMKNSKLASPPKTLHNETDQFNKIIKNTPPRDSSDYHELQNSVTKEECFQFQLSGYQDREHNIPQQKSPGNGQVSNAQRMEHVGYYPSPIMPHGSASPKGYPLHSRPDMRDSRQEYHYTHTLPPSAGFYSLDKNPTAQSSGIYSQDKNPTVQSSGIYSQDKNPTSQSSGIYSQDKNPTSQSSGIYSHVSSERSPVPSSSSQLRNQFSQSTPLPGVNGHSQMSPIGMFYSPPHTVISQYSPAQPISDRLSSNSVYPPSSQEMHLRDCRCPSCITKSSATKSAQNTHILDQRKLETQIPQGQQQHYIPKLQSSLYPPTQPNHIVGSSNMGGLPHNNQMIDHPPAMMRPSNSTIPPGYVQYHPVHKLIPTNPPITSSREFSPSRAQLHEIQFKQESYPTKAGMTPRFGCSNSGNKSTMFSPKMENEQIMRMYPQSQNLGYTGLKEERDFMMDPYGKEAYPSRPASLPTQDQEKNFPSGQFSFPQTTALPGSLSQTPITDMSAMDLTSERKSFELSNNDEEAPLDLSCKKAKHPDRLRSQSFSISSAQNTLPVSVRKGLNSGKPLNTFIKQIENSVDKYCHDKVQAASNATSPSLRPSPSMGEASLSTTLNSYQRQSPHLSPPTLTMPSQIAAAIQHASLYSVNNGRGSIVMGYPGIIPSTQQNKTQIENGGVQANSSQLTPKRSRSPVESEIANNDSSRSGSNGKRNNVSKHEPIQNIIGSHDATDILYLICRLCSQTYGSPYGFRKHFRNQHGFEPHAEHTVVQTISATKSALQTPPQGPVGMQMPLSTVGGISTSQAQPQTLAIPIVSSSGTSSPSHLGMIVEQQNSGAGLYPSMEYSIGSCNKGSEHGRNLSPTTNIVQNTERDFDSTSNSSAEKLKVDSEDMESVKYLECPECKKTFQLNDFGSYKRHCRQHSQMHMRANGPYLCTECHTSFPEMHLLREHMSNHVSDQSKGETATQQIVSGQISSHSGNNSVHSFPPEMAKSNDGSTKKAAISSSVVGGVSTMLTSSVVQSEHSLGPVLPGNIITHSPAECPDSSWDSNNKKTKVLKEKLKEEKTEETSSTEGNDSGYSPSGGSGSNFDDKNSDSQSEQGCNGELLNSRKSCDSQTNNGKTEVNTASLEYRHKKFGGQRKRETMDNSPGDCSKLKISKTTDLISTSTGEHSDSPSALSNVGSDVECLDISQTDGKGTDGNRGNESNSNVTDIKGDIDHSQEESKLIVKIKCTGTTSKQEARHNLPFVWDRVTRSKVGRRSKP
ncbi:hypothetical protein ACJMK2_021649 [Sinanodonta woodiana]|uniref:C2H2-type domain-containing protein n=1 Tax=Sinanodonta woodiana TaxID=1069815 RepID=A0ABD3TGP8_SINWO